MRTFAAIAAGISVISACDSPTGPSSNLDDLVKGRRVQLRLAFVATDISPDHWLPAGDTVIVRLTLTPYPGYSGGSIIAGTVLYEGVPLWATSERAAGAYQGTFHGPAHPGGGLHCFFQEGRPGSSEILGFGLRPAEGPITWLVEWFGPGEDFQARGVAELLPSLNPF